MRIAFALSGLAATALIATAALAADGDGAAAKPGDTKAAPAAPAAAAKTPSSTEYKDLKWQPLDPSNAKGPQFSVIWGDMQKGPVSFLLKVPAGFKAPVHMHTSDYAGVVVLGAPAHGDDEKSAKVHSVGSTWFEPGGHAHFDACTSKEDCLTQVTFPNGFDFKPVGAPAAPTTAKK